MVKNIMLAYIIVPIKYIALGPGSSQLGVFYFTPSLFSIFIQR